MKDKIKLAAEIINNSTRVVVSTGAGVSRESGIPTFRENQTGIWANFNPEELATVQGFLKNPSLVWDWYQERIKMIEIVEPNQGHYAIAELEKLIDDFILITQNIDNLHQKAGSKNVCELHGNIFQYKCFEEDTIIDQLPESEESPPRCPDCHGMIRPNVVWFGESLPEEPLNTAFNKSSTCDCIIVVGTSGQVQPAASLPFIAKQRSGAGIIEINPNRSAITEIADVFLQSKSGDALSLLVEMLKEMRF